MLRTRITSLDLGRLNVSIVGVEHGVQALKSFSTLALVQYVRQ